MSASVAVTPTAIAPPHAENPTSRHPVQAPLEMTENHRNGKDEEIASLSSQLGELRTELRLVRSFSAAESKAGIWMTGIRWTGAVVIAYIGYLAIAQLAGDATFADIRLSFLSDIRISQGVATLFGGSGMVYGAVQGKLRRMTIKRLGPRLKELEGTIDPGRGSSDLGKGGEKPVTDRLPT